MIGRHREDAIIVDAFINRWSRTESAERTNAAPFLIELCDLLGLGRPEPATGSRGAYRFERGVLHREDDRETTRRIDLYKRGCFILEAKQGASPPPQPELFTLSAETARRQMVRSSVAWNEHMTRALGQARGYVGDLPGDEPAPPFLIVCDVGFCFDVYADFSGTGRHYSQFPDRKGFRIYLPELRDPAIRARLAPSGPTRSRSTRRGAGRRSRWRSPSCSPALPRAGAAARAGRRRDLPDALLFCMFAQSVGLLPQADTFTGILDRCRVAPDKFAILVGDLWRAMNAGGVSIAAEARGAPVQRWSVRATARTAASRWRPARTRSACSPLHPDATGGTWSRPSSARCWRTR